MMYRWVTLWIYSVVSWTGTFAAVRVTVTDVQVNISTAGEPVTLGCQYNLSNASNPAIINWFKVDSAGENPVYSKFSLDSFGTPGPGYHGKVTLNGASIDFLYTNKTDAGTYNCTIEDAITRKSGTSQVYMMIRAFPETILIERMGSGDLKEDDKLQLTVSTTNARPLMNHHCTLGGQSLGLTQPAVYNVTDPVFDPLYGSTTSQLEIKVQSKDSDQQVQCCVADSNLCENFTVPSVSAHPNITTDLENQTLSSGGQLSWYCKAEGNPTPSIVWIKEATRDVVSNTSFWNLTNVALADSGWYICNASSAVGYDNKKVYLHVVKGFVTTESSSVSTSTSTAAPPKNTSQGYGWLAGGLACLACQVILDVAIYKTCKEKLVTGLGWLAVIASLVFVIMGDVCGIMAGNYLFPGNDIGVVIGIVIAVSCGFFLLGVGLGVMIGHGIWKLSQDEKLYNVIKKLRHIVLSIATFGGEVVGIFISFKIWGKKITEGGKHKEHRRNSVAPEEIAELGCRSDSAHSEGSIASHSKVPLHGANEQGPGKENKQMEKGAKKKKKKKKMGTQSQEVSCQGNSPRKLPPLRH